MRPGGRCIAQALALVLVCFHSTIALAAGFDDVDFSLRFPAALSRFSTYGDVTGVGGASAGSKWQSSANPAGMAWQPMPEGTHFVFSPQASTIAFTEGTRLNVLMGSFGVDAGETGRFLVSAAHAGSNKTAERSGLDYAFALDLVQLAWGKRLAPDWAVGFAFTYDQSHTDFGLSSTDISHTSDSTYSAKFGVHYRVSKALHLGLVFEQAATPSKTDYFDVFGTGVGTVRVEDTTWQTSVRPGIAFEYAPESTIYADYQFAGFSNRTGTLIEHRLFAGVEQKVFKGAFLRGGVNADSRGNFGWSAGVGFYPAPNISLDVGIQDNNFPEIESDFGRSRTYILSGTVSF